MIKKITGTCFIVLLYCVSLTHAQEQPNFPTDAKIELLKNFWIKMFTKYDDSVTLLHDENNPEIVYQIVEHRGFEHFQRKKLIDREINKVKQTLFSIKRKRLKNLNEIENDLLSKVPEQFRTLDNIKKISKTIRSQQGMSNRFQEGLQRSFRFMDSIQEIISKYNLPKELAYLPHVESSFNYFATSKVGAAGIWQLMPITAKHYKLRVTKNTDERLDPIKSTEVAIKLLRDNYKIVKSWPLAITAYNHGTKNINKTIREIKTYDPLKVLDSINKKSFQFASRNFYPSYLAAVEVSLKYNKYFPNLKNVESSEIAEFILDKRTNIEKISKKLKLSKEEIKQFNPQITGVSWKKNFTLPKGFIIKFPSDFRDNEKETAELLTFESVKKWFDSICGIVAQSIASNFGR